MSPTRALATAGLLVVVACGACVSPATGVVVALDTDAPNDRALTIRATISTGTMADGGSSRTWVRGGASGTITLPATFGVTPGSGPRNGVVTLSIDAELAAGSGAPALSFRRRAQFAFTPHETTRVPVFLVVSCGAAAPGCATVPADQCTVSTRCEELGLTCGDRGDCEDPGVHPQPLDGGGGPSPEGGVRDGASPAITLRAPAGHVGTVGAGFARVGGRAVLDDGLEFVSRTCVGTRCVTGGITP